MAPRPPQPPRMGLCRSRSRSRSSGAPLIIITSMMMMLLPNPAAAQACVAGAGTYCPSALGTPAACPEGYYCPSDGSGLVACPTGSANALAGQSDAAACVVCSGTSVALVAGARTCQACPAGSVYGGDGATCTPCAAGAYAASGAATCAPCAEGTTAAQGSAACSACRPGSFNAVPGAGACVACPLGTYTYTLHNGTGALTPVWGATAAAQCVPNPGTTPQSPLVCFPGTIMTGANCAPCAFGYYCPAFSSYPNWPGEVRACPHGTTTPSTGALSAAECTLLAPLMPITYARCAVTPGNAAALTTLNVRAAASTLDAKAVYLATATAVFRLYLQSNTLELLAGSNEETGSNFNNAVGLAARFTQLTAIAVDLDYDEAMVVVVGDGNAVRSLDVYTREVRLLGGVGMVTSVGGIALRRDPATAARLAYVSDAANHRLMVFNIDNPRQSATLLAGGIPTSPGRVNSYGLGARFRTPKGLAFLEHSLNASRLLLVADSGNGVLRVVDVETTLVSTWFAPQDTVAPEMVAPVSVSVSPQDRIVYVADSGALSAIQMPYYGALALTRLTLQASDAPTAYALAMPYGPISTGVNQTRGYTQLLVLDQTAQTLRALVQDALSVTDEGGGLNGGACHLLCANPVCAELSPAALCGNGFLDVGEECDAPGPDSGCASDCTIQRPGFTCLLGQPACLAPCRAYVYDVTNASHCAADCAAIVPPSGYTVDAQCRRHDIDECALGTDNCDSARSMCINLNGSFACRCFETYFGDGLHCIDSAYAVYTVIEIPSVQPSAILDRSDANAVKLMRDLLSAYASQLSGLIPPNLMQSATFASRDAAQLAATYTFYSLDPVTADADDTLSRLEIATLFETHTLAHLVAQTTDVSALAAALSQPLFGAATIGVSVKQAPKVRLHAARSFNSPFVQENWGMNLTGVTYRRDCALQLPPVEGWSVPPRGGCWFVEMLFMGGRELESSTETTLVNTILKQSKNVLYLPRIERDPDTLEPLAQIQTLTMSSGTNFPCDTKSASANGAGIVASSTACCLRAFDALYRPSTSLASFLTSPRYNAAAPLPVCENPAAINDTFPYSDVVYDLPADGQSTNDLVVGHIEGMPSSEVRLVETVDYTTRTFRVMLVLEEGDLRNHASMTQGVTGADYSMDFFVGLANFKGTTTSVLGVQNVRQFVKVSKSNSLTISTFGTNQDPLLTSQSMSLVRVKVSDFFNNVTYLHYLEATFTMPTNYQSPQEGGGSIVPLDSIRVIKSANGRSVSASDPGWQQACFASGNATYVYKDPELQARVRRAQTQECVQDYLQMCAPPEKALGVVSFGVPLPIGFITDADFAGAATGNPTVLQLQFVVKAYNSASQFNVLNTVSMSVQLTPLGVTTVCESISASQNLADIINGSIFIGIAETDREWSKAIQSQTAIQVPGSTPAKSLEFNTETVQSSIMTFSALGDYAYFQDPRYAGQSVHMRDIWTVNFLEPFDGTKTGRTPHFDYVKNLFFRGLAFEEVVDPATHAIWLKPSKALLDRCPLRPTVGKLACLTKAISTYANNTLTRSPKNVVEVLVGASGPASIAQMQDLMGHVFMNGGKTDRMREYGTNFYSQLSSKLGLTDNRYRKAYVVSPMVDWTIQAIEDSEPGKNAYTLSSKIIAIGLITIESAAGQQLARRLLSFGLETEPALRPSPERFLPLDASSLVSRRLLQQQQQEEEEGTSLAPSMTNTGNSLLMSLNVPGKEPPTELCRMLNASLPSCRMLEFTIQITPDRATAVCDAYAEGALPALLSEGFQSVMRTNDTNVLETLLTTITISGCVDPRMPGRRLLQYANVVVVVTNVLFNVKDGVLKYDPMWTQFFAFLDNATVTHALLGGQASVVLKERTTIPKELQNGTGTYYGNVTYTIYNASNATLWNLTRMNELFKPPPAGSKGSVAFITENQVNLLTLNAANAAPSPSGSSSSASRAHGASSLLRLLMVPWLNALVLIALASTCLY